MMEDNNQKATTAIFITFPGNCEKALTTYQKLFGGKLQLEYFEKELEGYTERPLVCGSLISDSIIIHGSDLVHDEGRKLGNYMSIFLRCTNADNRRSIISKLVSDKENAFLGNDQKLVEVTDAFDVKWILGI